MPTVADQLRLARESRQLSIDQVAELTKIRTDRIRALEAGEYNSFSATIYIRGSVKNYAKALKLDEARLLGALEAELKETEKFSEPPPLVETKKHFLDTVILVLSKFNWRLGFTALAALTLVAVAGTAWWAWRHHQANDPLKTLPPAVYQPANAGDTLPLPKP